MPKKPKRVWTDEQRQAAADRMNHARAVRMERLKAPTIMETDLRVAVPLVPLPGRITVREVLLRVRSDGQCVSQLGPCVCGKTKREWHDLCLRQGGAS